MATPSISIIDLVFGVLDRLFKDNVSGKIFFTRIFSVIVLFSLAMFWYKGEALMTIYKESRIEHFEAELQKKKDDKFIKTAKEQVQIVHVSSGADFTAVYSFRPVNYNFFVDLVTYQGHLFNTVDEKSLGGYPIDKTSKEYIDHLNGEYFESSSESIFLPTKQKTEFSYMFSCPFFNLDNAYAGNIALYWIDSKPKYPFARLAAICGQAGRNIGRSR